MKTHLKKTAHRDNHLLFAVPGRRQRRPEPDIAQPKSDDDVYGPAVQAGAGLEHIGVIESNLENHLTIVGIVTIGATASVASGLSSGIRRLSSLNLYLCLLLLLFVWIAGPTSFLAASFVQSIGYYLQHLPELTFRTACKKRFGT